MAMTIEQAKALVHVLTKGPAAIHIEAHVGHGRVPSVDDLESQDPDRLELVDDFISYVEEATSCLRGHTKDRPRQGKLELDGDTPKKRGGKR